MSYNVETTQKEILDQIDPSYQKTVGFPTYYITRAVALAVVTSAVISIQRGQAWTLTTSRVQT